MAKDTKHVTVKIPRDLIQEMDKLKGKHGFRSRGEIAKEAIRKLLAEYQQHEKMTYPRDENCTHRIAHSKIKQSVGRSRDPTWIADRGGRIIEANKKFEEFSGLSREDFVGKHFLELLNCDPERFPKLMIAFSEVLEGKEAMVPMAVKTVDGKRKIIAEIKPIKVVDDVVGITFTLKEEEND